MKILKKIVFCILVFVLLLFCVNDIAIAIDLKKDNKLIEENLSDRKDLINQNQTKKFSNSFNTFNLILVYGILIALALGVYYFFRKKITTFTEGELVNLIYNYPITAGKYIQIIEVLGEFYLIGLTANNITLLTKLDSEEIKHKLNLYKSERKPHKDFKSFFQKKPQTNQEIEELINQTKKRLKDL